MTACYSEQTKCRSSGDPDVFETYDKITLTCTGRQERHREQEIATILPIRPRIDLEAMVAMHEAAGEAVPAATLVTIENVRRLAQSPGYGVAGSMIQENGARRHAHLVRAAAVRPRRNGGWLIEIPPHSRCRRVHNINPDELFRVAATTARLLATRSPVVDISRENGLRL